MELITNIMGPAQGGQELTLMPPDKELVVFFLNKVSLERFSSLEDEWLGSSLEGSTDATKRVPSLVSQTTGTCTTLSKPSVQS